MCRPAAILAQHTALWEEVQIHQEQNKQTKEQLLHMGSQNSRVQSPLHAEEGLGPKRSWANKISKNLKSAVLCLISSRTLDAPEQ